MNIVNGGLPYKRWEGLKNGSYRAVTVMEPFISLALKEGAHIVAASFYRGGEVVAPELTPEQRKAYYNAENEAVDLINADFYKYAHHVAASAKGALAPHELSRAFVHYKHVDYYDHGALRARLRLDEGARHDRGAEPARGAGRRLNPALEAGRGAAAPRPLFWLAEDFSPS